MAMRVSRSKVLLEKNRLQLELDLQAKMIKGLKGQGWWADKSSDRFKAGKPDLRIAHNDFGQMDIELKFALEDFDFAERETGLKRLQQIKIEEMNKAGMPAICLVYSEPNDLFFVTTLLRDTLPHVDRCVMRRPSPVVISGPELFFTAMEHLNVLGYHTNSRDWRQAGKSCRA